MRGGSGLRFAGVQEGPWLGPLFTCGFLLYLAVLLWRKGRLPGAKPSLVRPLVTYYIVVTALVELTRFAWDVSRFALVWAGAPPARRTQGWGPPHLTTRLLCLHLALLGVPVHVLSAARRGQCRTQLHGRTGPGGVWQGPMKHSGPWYTMMPGSALARLHALFRHSSCTERTTHLGPGSLLCGGLPRTGTVPHLGSLPALAAGRQARPVCLAAL